LCVFFRALLELQTTTCRSRGRPDPPHGLTRGKPRFSNDGDYDLRIVLALCKQERTWPSVGQRSTSIAANEKQQRIGLYDYLHRA
jgi:hypothetical protein